METYKVGDYVYLLRRVLNEQGVGRITHIYQPDVSTRGPWFIVDEIHWLIPQWIRKATPIEIVKYKMES